MCAHTHRYPFDYQTVVIQFTIKNMDLGNCVGGAASGTGPLSKMGFVDDASASKALLPSNNEWYLDGSYDQAVQFERLPSSGDNYLGERCQMSVKIKRNPTVFTVKNIFMTILVVEGALLTSVFMHPDDHIGDRSACLFIAFLILVTNMQTDLGLGRLSELIWLDWFNLIQLGLVLVAVAETMIVHQMLKRQKDMLATNVDLSSRTVMPFVLYPGVTGATLIGFLDTSVGGALLAAAVVVSVS